jgi:cyclic pyranopterin monophosphate synthase
MEQLTHIDAAGNAAMVNVADKQPSKRTAVARSYVQVPHEVLSLLAGGDIVTAKGAVFQTARLAGIMAAKQTPSLIPLCHSIGLEHCEVTIVVNDRQLIEVLCSVAVTAKTGVEMEALVGASVAALTIYDMCKALSHNIVILETQLIEKKGGKNDFKREQ